MPVVPDRREGRQGRTPCRDQGGTKAFSAGRDDRANASKASSGFLVASWWLLGGFSGFDLSGRLIVVRGPGLWIDIYNVMGGVDQGRPRAGMAIAGPFLIEMAGMDDDPEVIDPVRSTHLSRDSEMASRVDGIDDY